MNYPALCSMSTNLGFGTDAMQLNRITGTNSSYPGRQHSSKPWKRQPLLELDLRSTKLLKTTFL